MKIKLSRLFLAIANLSFCLFLFATTANALTFVGTSSPSNPGSTSGSGSYGVLGGGDSEARAVGYRFTIVGKNGTRHAAPLDLYRNATCASDGFSYDALNHFSDKYSKVELQNYSGITFSTTTSTAGSKRDTAIGVSELPLYTTGIKTWCTETNINKILPQMISGWTTKTLAENGCAILIEPIYGIKIENVQHSLTVTEIAVYGASKFGASAGTSTAGGSGSWGWISSFTNRHFPNSLYLPSAYFNLGAASTLSSNATFDTIISKGYGAALVYEENLNYKLTVNYYSNGATSSFSGALNTVGAGKNVLVRTYDFYYSTAYPDGLHDYAYSSAATYLAKTGYNGLGEGSWGTTTTGGTVIGQEVAFSSGAALAEELGLDTSSGNTSINLYALWEPNVYTISYNGNGATGGSTASSTHTYDVAKALTSNGFTKTGYTFKGWNTKADGSGTSYANQTSVKNLTTTNSGTVTLYAQWTPNKYTLTFDSNGGTLPNPGANLYNSVNSGNSVTVTYGSTNYYAMSGDIPTKTGYSFKGWYTATSGGTQVYNANGVATKDGVYFNSSNQWVYTGNVTVYAQWTQNSYSLTVDPNGGTYNGSTNSSTTSHLYNSTVSIEDPSRTGYQFNGWNVSSASQVWMKQLAIGYTDSVYTGVGSLSKTNKGTYTNYKWSGLNATGSSWNNMCFNYYDVAAGETITISGWVRVNSNTAGTALNFYHGAEHNDYSNAKASISNTNGEWQYFSFSRTFTEAASANFDIYTSDLKGKTGGIDFDLKGISITREDGTTVPTQLTMPAGAVTLTAQWTPKSYPLTVNPNGGIYNGSTDASTTSHLYNSTVSVEDPSRTGYQFDGWSVSSASDVSMSDVWMRRLAVGYTNNFYTGVGSGSRTLKDTYTNYKWTGLNATGSAWNCLCFNYYDVAAGETVTISGWVRVNSNTAGTALNFYHGDKHNDYTNAKASISNTNGEWQYFSFSRTFTEAASANFDIYTNDLKGKTGEIDFDLKGISITREDVQMKQLAVGYTNNFYTGVGSGSRTLKDTYTNYKWTGLNATGSSWNNMCFNYYDVAAGETVTISGWVRVNSNTAGTALNFYHGAEHNDFSNCKASISNTNGEWQYFSFSRTFTEAASANFDIYTSDLKGKTGGIDFDLKGISITREDGSTVPTQLTMPAGTVTLTAQWTPITYTIEYDGNGHTDGATESSTHTYDVVKELTANGYTKNSHTFVGWNTKADGTGISYADKASVKNLTTSGTVTLYAQWVPNSSDGSYVVSYNGNGATEGDDWTETVDMSTVTEYAVSDDDTAFVRVEVDEETGAAKIYKFVGWTINGEPYDFGTTLDNETLKDLADKSSDDDSGVIVIYAAWDEQPIIDAVDRWFSLDEAQAGKITLEELLKTAVAVDGEVGDVTDFGNGQGTFTILGYNDDNKDTLADEFKNFDATGSVTVTYQVIDKAGNEVYRTVTVHIVDKHQQIFEFTTKFTRFISSKYFKDSEGNYIAESNGGLNAKSVWIKDHEFNEVLVNALSNTKNEETGEWQTVYKTWIFTEEQIANVKEYIETHGLGNTQEEDALISFYNQYETE